MNIKNVLIIGLGLIGGSIAKALKKVNSEIEISAYDLPEVLNEAVRLKVIDNKTKSLSAIDDYDFIFLCLPVDLSLTVFKEIAPKISKNTILTDVCGVKAPFEQIWSSIKSEGFFVGGHPMTGKEKSGFENSDPILFENSIYIISDTKKDSVQVDKLISLVKLLGARPKYVNPYMHDRIIAHVSHLPQLLAVTLMNSVAKSENEINYLDFAAGGFRDMTRIASSEYKVWEPIIKSNKNQILESLDTLMEELTKLKFNILEENTDTINDNFEQSRIKRDVIPRNAKGFITQLYDIFVFVTDQPGVISKISTKLFENNINIKDIELLKIRVGTGGTFRLSFDTEDDALKAKSILEDLGFRTDKN